MYKSNPFDKKNIEDITALTPIQQGLLFHYLKEPDAHLYFEQLSIGITGPLKIDGFKQAWNVVTQTNEMLRTLFRWDKLKHPMQIILKSHSPYIRYYDLTTDEHFNLTLKDIKTNDWDETFDLKKVPFRITLCKIDADKFEMVLSNHHILFDGWSTGIILTEFFKAYNCIVKEKPVFAPHMKTKFKNFVQWMQNRDRGINKNKEERFWRNYLDGFDKQSQLPLKRQKPGEKGAGSPGNYPKQFDPGLKDRLDDLSASYGLTLAPILFCAWGVLLQKYNHSSDVLFGTTVSGRSAKISGIEEIVGLFINTVPLRVQLQTRTREKTIDFLHRIQRSLQQREAYELTPLVNIKEYSEIDNKEELFDTIVTIENYPLDSRLLPEDSDLSVDSYRMLETSHYDLTVTITVFNGIEVNMAYPGEVFARESLVKLTNHFANVVKHILNHPEGWVTDIEILSPEEKQQVLTTFNCTQAGYPKDKTLHRLFTEQVERAPDRTAINGQGQLTITTKERISETMQLTYREVERKSRQWARLLLKKGVMPGFIVAIMLEPSIEMIIGILGILKIGALYLPIEPDYPQKRIDYMLGDSSTNILAATAALTKESETIKRLKAKKNIRIVLLDISSLPNSQPSTLQRFSHSQPANPVYVLYTSGSTGRPKGVIVEHHSVINLLSGLFKKYSLKETDSYLLKTTFTFDVSVSELLGWFWGGGRLKILEKDRQKDINAIIDAVESFFITHINFVPAAFHTFIEALDARNIHRISGLQYIFLAGDVLIPGLVNQFKQFNTNIILENLYGPTEGTVYASGYSLGQWNRGQNIPIGKPWQNVMIYILDKSMQPQPVGVKGELCIAGDGVARGYVNNPELTSKKFKRTVISHSSLVMRNFKKAVNSHLSLVISSSKERYKSTNDQCPMTNDSSDKHSPYSPHSPHSPYSPIYRTGDLALWLPDGNIEFLGRIDLQVKIRGVRIEPGEIESCLLAHESISETLVVVNDDGAGDKYLCAYITARRRAQGPGARENRLDPAALRNYLSAMLPEYMIPSHFVQLNRLPLTPTGKFDRKALPGVQIKPALKYAAPGNETERMLVNIWADILAIDRKSIGINDDFFRLGGHSLKAMSLINRIHRWFNAVVPLAEIFKRPTIKALSTFIKQISAIPFHFIKAVEKKEYYGLSSGQQRMYVLFRVDTQSTAYNMPNFFVLSGRIQPGRMEQIFKHLVHRHESLRTSFHLKEDEPVQKVHDETAIDHWSLVITETVKNKTDDTIRDFINPFDLSQAPLLRVGLIPIEEDKYILMLDMHHIISDGVSMVVLLQEFAHLYDGGSLAGLRLQYKDFSSWQNKLFLSAEIKKQEAYWRERFRGEIPRLTMPLDFSRPSTQTFAGSKIRTIIPAAAVEKLRLLMQKENVTLNIVLFTIYTLLVAEYSGQEDIIIGALAAGRRHVDLEYIIGMFANFLPIRNFVDKDSTIKEFLNSVKHTLLDAYENQDYPFERIVEKLAGKDISRNPLFDTMLIVHNETDSFFDLEMKNLTIEPYNREANTSELDFKLDVLLTGFGELDCALEYNTNLFKEESIKGFIENFTILIEQVIQNLGQSVGQLSLFTAEKTFPMVEKRQRSRGHTAPSSPLPSLNVVVTATFTSEPIRDYIRWWGKQFYLEIHLEFAPYNQVFQQLLTESSLLSTNTGVNILLIRFEDWLRDINEHVPDEDKCNKLEKNFQQLTGIFRNKPKQVPYLVGIFPVSTHLSLSPPVMRYLEEMNRRWRDLLTAVDMSRVMVMDFTCLAEMYQVSEVFDAVMDREGHIPFAHEFNAAVGTAIARKIIAFNHYPFKVIVLDCDYTLWHGICGEDGPLGVKVEGPYLELQRFMMEMYNQGFLLALCSKNNQADVWDVFEKNPDMVLKPHHFVSWRIDWKPKSENIKALARELNLAVDSFIFIDDNPSECSEVMYNCPGVLTLKLPGHRESTAHFLGHIWALDKAVVTVEDRQRTRMYLADKKRRESAEKSLSLTGYLAELEIEIAMNVMKPDQLTRVSQLTQRTNQFNLSTLRRQEQEIQALTQQPGVTCWVIEVGDRFGDYGLVGVVITRLEKDRHHLFIDTFLLSCRVLGREVENAILVGLRKYGEKNLVKTLRADYYPTPKNKPVLEFLERHWTAVDTERENSQSCQTPGSDSRKPVTFTLALARIPTSTRFGKFYFQTRAKRNVPNELTVERKTIPPSTPVISGQKLQEWDVYVVNRENLLHKRHLLPLQYPTAAKLLTLPTYKADESIARLEVSDEYESPVNEIQLKLSEIWQGLLKVAKPGINESFFHIGGNSLRAVMLVSKIHKEFSVLLELKHIFENPTIKTLSQVITDSRETIYSSIELSEKKEYYQLSSAQERLYVIHQLEPGNIAYNIPSVLEIEGVLPGEKLQHTFAQLIKRHESLRTSFHMKEGEPVQRIHDEVEFKIEYYDLTTDEKNYNLQNTNYKQIPNYKFQITNKKETKTHHSSNNRIIHHSFIRPFDLSRAPLLRVGAVKLEETRYILMVDMHHIITDGTSAAILVQDFMTLYAREEDDLARLKLQYKDFSEWQNKESRRGALKNQEKYWLEIFSGDIPVLDMPTDYLRPAFQRFEGARVRFGLNEKETRDLRDMAKTNDATLYMCLLAIFYVFLYKLSGQEDIVVGTPMAARQHADLGNLVGMFVNTLAMRCFPTSDKTFPDFLHQVKERTLDALNNQDYQFEDLVENKVLERDASRNPLFDVLFALQNVDIPKTEIPGLKVKQYNYQTETSLFDLSLDVFETADGLSFVLGYSTKLFREETIHRFTCYLKRIITAVPGDTRVTLAQIDILPEGEKRQLLFDFNDTGGEYLVSKTIAGLFAEEAACHPELTAVSSYLDAAPIFEHPEPGKTDNHLQEKLENLCFKRNPYIFEFKGVAFLEALNIFTQEENRRLIVLETHRQNYLVVNKALHSLLDYFDGKTNIKSIFKGLSRAKPWEFLLYSLERESEESDFKKGSRYRLVNGDNFERAALLVKALLDCHLIQLVDYNSGEFDQPIFIPAEEEDEGVTLKGKGEMEIDRPVHDNQTGKSALKSPVLLMGDRTGSATTGLLYIASFLRRNGIEAYCQWNDINTTTDLLKNNVEKLLAQVQPRIVGVSMKWFPHIARVLKICRFIKEFDPSITIVVGGNTASYYKEKIIADEYIDYVLLGDGELPMLKLCRGEEDIPNCIHKKDGKMIETPISYVQDETNSSDIYLSHLDRIFVSAKDPYLAHYFYICTGKGCAMPCFYCGGCRDAQKRTFNRAKPFMRRVSEVRTDIMAAKQFTSTFMFDFDLPVNESLDYFKRIYQGLDLSRHFCGFYFWKLPAVEILDYIVTTFKFVYINIDLCSLSEPHRLKLSSSGLVKPQPTDEELFAFFDHCEKYDNIQVIINQITGLPYFSIEDIRISNETLSKLLSRYSSLTAMDWGRLHAQPGAPIVETYKQYNMHCYATTFEEFLHYSKLNMEEDTYPVLLTFHYPYIYSKDDDLNSKISIFYIDTNNRVKSNYDASKEKSLSVVFDLTYAQLDARTDWLAMALRAKGVKPGVVVAVLVERSLEMITALLAIVKARGAYLPLTVDFNYPTERIAYMLADSNAAILLTQGHLLTRCGEIRFNGEIMDISDQALYIPAPINPAGKPDRQFGARSLAYILYTSGSTGKPKGVMVEHGSVARLVKNTNYIHFAAGDRLLLTGNLVFDITTFEIWGSLLNGVTLFLADQENILDANKLRSILAENRITIMHLVPQLFNQLVSTADDPEIFAGLRCFLVGGDLVRPEFINKLRAKFKKLKILHMYGPTENTTFSTYFPVERNDFQHIPLGKPISHSQAYIFSKNNQLQPIGVKGELCVAGNGLARGYLNNPELTCEKFKIKNYKLKIKNGSGTLRADLNACGENKKVPGKRINMSYMSHRSYIYHTGDLARWLPDGNIQFLGRIDQQVKIRGFRIDPGEIELQLLKHDLITEAVVLDRQEENGEKYLCAYIVSKETETPDLKELKEYLSRDLPVYMIPAYFINIDGIPLTPNGKVDRNALPVPGIITGEEYAPPRNEPEEKLAAIWTEVLGHGTSKQALPSIHDNFFEIGGDSIKSIQVVSRMKKAGYKLEIRDIFKHPRISELASVIKRVTSTTQQSIISGTVPLSPVQKRFFENRTADRHHFNQAVMFHSSEGFREEAVKAIFGRIQEHHDALRMTYKEVKGVIKQFNHALDYPLALQVYDLQDLHSKTEAIKALETRANEIQASINLETGPLMKLGLFHLEDGDLLLVVIHHLVIDGVSWRILFEDTATLYRQYKNGQKLILPLKTDSFKIWSERLSQYADSDVFLTEKTYWQELESTIILPLERNFAESNHYLKDSHQVSFGLSEEDTDLLLTRVNKAFGTEINDILLTALGLGIKKSFGNDRVLIALEGHGREQILAGVDVTRTVGWFTSLYPVVLDFTYETVVSPEDSEKPKTHLARQIIEVKERLRALPQKGIGYGILKYLTSQKNKQEVAFKLKPQVSFNYLGQFDAHLDQMPWAVVKEPVGSSQSANSKLQFEINVNGVIVDGKLTMSAAYSKKQYKTETIASFLDHFKRELSGIISYCCSRKEKELTPSDLTYKKLSIETLDKLKRQYPLEDIYPLTPIQEGMLFHDLYEEKKTTMYFEQISYRFHGKLDIPLVETSLKQLIKRHDILCTVFVHEGFDRLLQIVLAEKEINVYYKDISGMKTPGDRKNFIREFKDKDKLQYFDLSRDRLIRVAVIQPADEEYFFIWSFHHILMDGWCIGILIQEYLEIYNSYLENRPCQLTPVQPYRRFIQWLENRKTTDSRSYWQDYLASYEDRVGISSMKLFKAAADENKYKIENFSLVLTREKTDGLLRLAVKNHVTLNTVIQAVWGIILGKYNSKEDVVFGGVVSGRPPEIEGVERMVGLFINMIPVRIQFAGKKRFNDLLTAVQEEAISAEPHHHFPLAEIQALHHLKGNLFDHILVLENYPLGEILDESNKENRWQISDVQMFEHTNYHFHIAIIPGNNLEIRFIYNVHLYQPDYAVVIANHLKEVLDQILKNETVYIEELNLLSEEEKRQLIREFNHTRAEFPQNKAIDILFAQQVERTPDSTALTGQIPNSKFQIPNLKCSEGTRGLAPLHLTYRELSVRANQLAYQLIKKGVQADTIVGIMLGRSLQMIIAVLAILKSGGTYLPIEPDYPPERVRFMLADARAPVLLTRVGDIKTQSFTMLQEQQVPGFGFKPFLTASRPPIADFDSLPFPDRSLIDYEKYNRSIGLAMVKNSISLQGTRGCPYHCAYCHKIWPKTHVVRSAENILEELRVYYNMGIKRFALVDDIFNLDRKNSTRFFKLIIDKGLKLQLFFPNGVRGDLLSKEYIDLMVEAGTTGLALALETAAPRLQKLIGKHLNLGRLRENLEYFCRKYPHVILELFTMHGFPSETEAEAMLTLDFIKTLKWLHFPYFHILKIYPNTDMEKLALENGIPEEAIIGSANLAYHELPGTLPFDKGFTLKSQADFLNNYFLSKERLLHVLPYQLQALTRDEIVQKYDSYLPADISGFDHLLEFVGISEEQLNIKNYLPEDSFLARDLNKKMKDYFPQPVEASRADRAALRILLLDLSQYFREDSHMLYDVVEPPLGLMYIMTYLNEQLGKQITGKIAKSRIDFDNYTQLQQLLAEFQPDVIGIRTLTFYEDFFHRTVAMIRHWGYAGPVIAGGPYATSDYSAILRDSNVNLVVIGEGELTFTQLIREIIANKGQLPSEAVLKQIPGLAFVPTQSCQAQSSPNNREIIFLETNKSFGGEVCAKRHAPCAFPLLAGGKNKPENTAYIIYTSGTTGKPKGVMINHKNVVSLLFNNKFQFDFSHSDIWTLFHSFCFDFSVWEMYGALFYGGKLVVIPKMVARDPGRFYEVLRKHQVTVLNQTPSAFYQLMDEALTDPGKKKLNIRYVIFGGEALKPAKLKEWQEKYPGTKMVNMFGITETTVHVTYKELTPGDIDLNISNIGKPIPTLCIYIVDRNLKLVPLGVPGELCVGGAGLARGYLNMPASTAKRFVKNPYKNIGLLYRSGDQVRAFKDGEIEYLGRIDQQVKIRGFRVEPGEIENRLLRHGVIKEAVVLARQDRRGETYLAAYIVPEKKPGMSDIRSYLSPILPDYMIPSHFMLLEALPLTPNGKLDRKALPEVEVKTGSKYVGPGNETERTLVRIWSEVLEIDRNRIGMDDDFFRLGGHSLKAVRLINKMHKAFEVKVPLTEIFGNPTIKALSLFLADTSPGKTPFTLINPVEKREYYVLSPAQRGLYVVFQAEPDNTAYNITNVLILEGQLHIHRMEQTFGQLIKRHESLRTSFFMKGEEPMQRIHHQAELEIQSYDLDTEVRRQKTDDRRQTTEDRGQETGNRPGTHLSSVIHGLSFGFVRSFDLASAPLFRVGLKELEKEKHVLMIDMHHIISDGTSHAALAREFMAIYAGEGRKLTRLSLQYKEFSEWRHHRSKSTIMRQQEAFWLEELKGDIPVLNLPTDYERKVVQDFKGDFVDFEISREETTMLKAVAAEAESTLYLVLLSLWYILLSKVCGQEDIVLGSVVEGRNHDDLRQVIGMFVNTLALRNYPRGEKSFRVFLQEVGERTLKALENQDYPFIELVEKLSNNRDVPRNPLTDVVFMFLNTDIPDIKIPGLKLTHHQYKHPTAMFDLTIVGREEENQLFFTLRYRTGLFEAKTIERYARYFKDILSSILEDQEIRLEEITLAHDLVAVKSSTVETAFEF